MAGETIYNYYKAAIKLRNTYPVIGRGETRVVEGIDDKNICAFIRYTDEQTASQFLQSAGDNASENGFGPLGLLVIVNTSDEEKVVDISEATEALKAVSAEADSAVCLAYQLNTSDVASALEGNSLKLAPYGVAVMKVE